MSLNSFPSSLMNATDIRLPRPDPSHSSAHFLRHRSRPPRAYGNLQPSPSRLWSEAGGGRVDVEEEFTSYVAARWPRLVRSAVLLGCSPAEAEDVVQTTLERCLLRWRRVSSGARPRRLRPPGPDQHVHLGSPTPLERRTPHGGASRDRRRRTRPPRSTTPTSFCARSSGLGTRPACRDRAALLRPPERAADGRRAGSRSRHRQEPTRPGPRDARGGPRRSGT